MPRGVDCLPARENSGCRLGVAIRASPEVRGRVTLFAAGETDIDDKGIRNIPSRPAWATAAKADHDQHEGHVLRVGNRDPLLASCALSLRLREQRHLPAMRQPPESAADKYR